MAIIKEFREWFLRNTSVTSGAKGDQELGFPTSININGEVVGNRFLDFNKPPESVFRKLFESLTFKLNPEDTAGTTQGLVRKSTDNEILARIYSGNFTAIVEPHHIPEIVADINGVTDVLTATQTLGNVTIEKYTRTVSGKVRNIYKVLVGGSGGGGASNLLKNISNDPPDSVPGTIETVYDGTAISIGQIAIGDQLEIGFGAQQETLYTGNEGAVSLRIGGTISDTNGDLIQPVGTTWSLFSSFYRVKARVLVTPITTSSWQVDIISYYGDNSTVTTTSDSFVMNSVQDLTAATFVKILIQNNTNNDIVINNYYVKLNKQ